MYCPKGGHGGGKIHSDIFLFLVYYLLIVISVIGFIIAIWSRWMGRVQSGLVAQRKKFPIWFRRLFNNPDWWRIATIRTLAFERHVRMNFLAYKFIGVGNFGGCCCKCTSFYLLNCSSSPVVITVMVDAVSEFELWTVCACSETSCTLLIAIANAAVLDSKDIWLEKMRILCNHFQLTDAVDVTMLAKWHWKNKSGYLALSI